MIELITLLAATALAFALGFAIAWAKGGKTREQLAAAEARAEEQAYANADKLAIVATAKSTLSDTFKALSADALDASSRSFMQLATAQLGAFQEKSQGLLGHVQPEPRLRDHVPAGRNALHRGAAAGSRAHRGRHEREGGARDAAARGNAAAAARGA